MTLLQRIAVINEQKVHFQNLIQGLQLEFLNYITNRDIALEDRWDFWLNAPTELKIHSEWITENFVIRDFVERIYCIEKRSKINLETFLINLKSNKYLSIDLDDMDDWELDRLNEFKEAVLSENLGSYFQQW